MISNDPAKNAHEHSDPDPLYAVSHAADLLACGDEFQDHWRNSIGVFPVSTDLDLR